MVGIIVCFSFLKVYALTLLKENVDVSDNFHGEGNLSGNFASVRQLTQSRQQIRNIVASLQRENWDSDFEVENKRPLSGLNVQSSVRKDKNVLAHDSPFRENNEEDYSDLLGEVNMNKLKKLSIDNRRDSSIPRVLKPSDIISIDSVSSFEREKQESKPLFQVGSAKKGVFLEAYVEGEKENDFASVFGDDIAFSSNSSSVILQSKTPAKANNGVSQIFLYGCAVF